MKAETVLTLGVLGAVVLGVIYFRKEIQQGVQGTVDFFDPTRFGQGIISPPSSATGETPGLFSSLLDWWNYFSKGATPTTSQPAAAQDPYQYQAQAQAQAAHVKDIAQRREYYAAETRALYGQMNVFEKMKANQPALASEISRGVSTATAGYPQPPITPAHVLLTAQRAGTTIVPAAQVPKGLSFQQWKSAGAPVSPQQASVLSNIEKSIKASQRYY